MYVYTHTTDLGNTEERERQGRLLYKDTVKVLPSTDTAQEYFEIRKITFSLRQN